MPQLANRTRPLEGDPIRLSQNLHILAADFTVKEFTARFESTECAHVRYRGTIATKSRTGFCSAMENAVPLARLNQKALDEPPSRLSARWTLKSGAKTVARMLERSARVTSEQNPKTALSPAPVAANVRRAGRVDSRPRTGLPRSTTIGPHSTATSGFCAIENSATREICTFLADPLSTPLSKRAFCSGAIIAPSTTSSPIGL